MLDYIYANADRINLVVGYVCTAIFLLFAVLLVYKMRKDSHGKGLLTLNAFAATPDTPATLTHNYYEMALYHASIQFWFSIIASVIGFIFIIAMMLTTRNAEWFEYVFKIIPGAIIEAVSALFFKQSAEIRKQASEYFDKLRADEQLTKSIELVSLIEDSKSRASVISAIALHLCGIKDSQLDKENESQQ